jgi:hypothetical protein
VEAPRHVLHGLGQVLEALDVLVGQLHVELLLDLQEDLDLAQVVDAERGESLAQRELAGAGDLVVHGDDAQEALGDGLGVQVVAVAVVSLEGLEGGYAVGAAEEAHEARAALGRCDALGRCSFN